MKQPIRKQIVKHKDWCASVTMILTSYPPQIPSCNCSAPAGEDIRPKDWVKLGLSPSTEVEDWPIGGKPVTQNQCDGCIRGIPIVNGVHRDEQYFGMVCSKKRYGELS